jgi:hypothetical protein
MKGTWARNRHRVIEDVACGAFAKLGVERGTADTRSVLIVDHIFRNRDRVSIELTLDEENATNLPQENGKSREHRLMGENTKGLGNKELLSFRVQSLLAIHL